MRMKYFVSQGHKVFSIVFPKTDVVQSAINGIIKIELQYKILSHIFLLKRVLYIFQIRKITKRYKLDILHVINAESMILSAFSKSKKTVIENQGSDVLTVPQKYPWVKLLYRIFYRFTDAVIQDSKISQEAGINYGAPKENNKVINIGVDISIFNDKVQTGIARKNLGIDEDEPMIFSSRGMKEIYNIDTIVNSIPKVKEKYPRVKFVFASNYGELPKNLGDFIKSNSIENNVIYTGWLDHEKEMPFYYRDANVVVSVPSSDSSPFSVYEAMACKTPVIVTDLPWINGRFTSRVHLVPVPIRNSNVLANEIVNLLDNNTTIDLDSAQKIIFDKININKENKRLENLYQLLLSESY